MPRPPVMTSFLSSVLASSLGLALLGASPALAGPYAPAAGQPGSTAIDKDSPLFSGWANQVVSFTRAPWDINVPAGPTASFGVAANALGHATSDPLDSVSLGDGGQITLGFATPIANGAGADLAVFENGFGDTFLELAFVEVSTDGSHFLRFPSVSLTPTTTQVAPFGTLDPTNLDGLAGKYRGGFGTPFDLQDLAAQASGNPDIDLNDIRFVRVVDVVGRITAAPGNPGWSPSVDSQNHIVNDPYATNFAAGGFDIDSVGVINAAAVNTPEPASLGLLTLAGTGLIARRRRTA
ncbi:MAG: PEP-CTERM sorting domain-containing protein [Planctomycetota bacterium]|nr:PEP-CTERM sorting domain-containing protein [Planctomycetota bacterium]